jgi:hypothetical protein
MTPAERTRLAIAAIVFGLGATVAYVALRLSDHARGLTFDPTTLGAEPHVSYYWRAATASFWGGLVAIVAYALAGRARDPSAWVGRLALAAIPIGVAHLLLSGLFP